MEITLDKVNFEAKQPFVRRIDTDEANHLYLLFCHEVGHGMVLDHDEENSLSVMYPYIKNHYDEEVDFKEYFKKIKIFLSKN